MNRQIYEIPKPELKVDINLSYFKEILEMASKEKDFTLTFHSSLADFTLDIKNDLDEE